jgi:hypothetical protein
MPYKDPEKQKAAQRESAKRRRESIRVTVQRQRGDLIAYIHSKKQDPCMDCGVGYPPCVMEFDHVRGEKVIGVGRMANQRFPITAIDEEIAKCDLVCANCHRLRHMK